MQAALEIRTARDADCESISDLFAHYVRHSVATFELVPPSPPEWQAKLKSIREAGWPFLVAQQGGQLAGFAYVAPWRPKPAYRHTVEDSIYLSSQHMGRGLGGRLLARLLAEAATAGARQVVAVIADTGEPASMSLHRRAGFREAGRLHGVGYKFGRWIDTTLMQLDLSALSPPR
ncbi:MAG: GNAT family N-acetyltransferase [Candidatus Dormibacter sp.]|uniref:GNAT family N-acetyltransferase n=1 Tax=Candidatus Dormibacter sp. TaxID=2973982 RepID=UPI000DB1EF7E|nr:MAG: GNAT family N-acetyltransferase [Candidatus Dormibacteraeota bacterium]